RSSGKISSACPSMKLPFFVLAVAPFVAACHAGPTERAILAAMKLSEQPSYSWTSVVVDDARSYDLEGRMDRSGYPWMRLPMVKEFSLRLGREAGMDLEAVFRSATAYVVSTDHGWKTIDELPRRPLNWNDDFDYWPPPPGARVALAAASS